MKKAIIKSITFSIFFILIIGISTNSVAHNDACSTANTNTISAGNEHTVIIKTDGSLWMCGGENKYNQWGNGVTDSTDEWADLVSISAGYNYTAAIRADKSLWMWGHNEYGQLSGAARTGTYYGKGVGPVKVMDDVSAVSAGLYHTVAIKADGTLWTWGRNDSGQLGIGSKDDSELPQQIMSNIVAASAGWDCTAAITADGTLWMWGGNKYGQLGIGTTDSHEMPIKVLDHVKVAVCGRCTTYAIKYDGSLWAWGWNNSGALGVGNTENSFFPIKVMDHVLSVSAGELFAAAVRDDHTLWTWGLNANGQLGNNDTKSSYIPVFVMSDTIAVSAGSYHTVALKSDGTAWAWGNNDFKQLGTGTRENSNTPIFLRDDVGLPSEYYYGDVDYGSYVTLNTVALDGVINAQTAEQTVIAQATEMTPDQKRAATGVDLASLYAETAVAKAASTSVSGNDILINAAAIADLVAVAKQTNEVVETALVNGGISTARYLANTVTLKTQATGEISIRIDPDILTTDVDKITVEAPTYAVTIKVDDLAEDLTEILTFTAQDVGSGYAAGKTNGKATVKVNMPNGKTTNPVTLSLPTDSTNASYQAVVNTEGQVTTSKYNPATLNLDGKINSSGSYTIQNNQKDFTDISNKSAEMQKAINYLASKGIINGTSSTTFSPDASISRAEIAALLVRAIGKLDSNAKNTFSDVKASDWYYSAAGSSQKVGLIKGYSDNSFRGTTPINKEQIVAVAARVLTSEMGYKTPANTATYLSRYSDGVVNWAQPEVALATKENLVVYRVDGTFKGSGNMTRGDAAIIIYRLFQRIW